MTVREILTIGHSTRTAEEFLLLLQQHQLTALADIRTVPGSRRHPHFAREALAAFLSSRGVAYMHIAGLGGLRKPRRDSPNGGWRHPSFRGYADHMQTDEFEAALGQLLAFAEGRQTAIMCAEARWWQCHRRLVADALVARGIEVRHVLSARECPPHELSPFARIENTRVTYPALV